MDGALYFKENRKTTPSKNYIHERPLTLPVSQNVFFQANASYYESINGFEEAVVSNGAINVSFEKPTNPLLKNFRMIYHTIVDRHLALDDSIYTPATVDTHIVDALRDIDTQTLQSLEDEYSIYEHPAIFSHI